MRTSLGQIDLKALDDYLMSGHAANDSMGLSDLDGFLTGNRGWAGASMARCAVQSRCSSRFLFLMPTIHLIALSVRVGVSLGDAIADGTDLHGEAVNVVARLQTECPPGGICVSRSVRDHVHGRLLLGFSGTWCT
jgi:class 3 adenylate cyclase